MARGKTAAKAKSVGSEPSRPTTSKANAARAALAAGHEGPQQAVSFIQKEFGVIMSPQHFSAVKSLLRKKAGSPSRRKSTGIEGYLAPPPQPSRGTEGELLDMMETMKPLIALYGADKVKRIVDLLG